MRREAHGLIGRAIRAVRYLLRGYLRVRLAKAEEHVMALLDDAEALERLSAKERAYASQYFRLFGRQMKACLLEHLPPCAGSGLYPLDA